MDTTIQGEELPEVLVPPDSLTAQVMENILARYHEVISNQDT